MTSRLISRIKNKFVQMRYKQIGAQLRSVKADVILLESQNRLSKATQKAFTKVPAYKKVAAVANIDLSQIKDLKYFEQMVPVCDKESFFEANSLSEISVDHDVSDARLFYSSSGSSSSFSYGVETWDDAKHQGFEVEFLLEENFQAFSKKSLVVNCLPMGVKIQTRTISLIESGQRADVICSLLKKVKPDFDQFIIIGEHLFLKKLLEYGLSEGVKWSDLNVHIVTGGEYVPENFRIYVEKILGIFETEKSESSFNISFGISEVSNSVARETVESQKLRRLAHQNPEFREQIYGKRVSFCAPLVQYIPYQFFMEVSGNGEEPGQLILTTLDANRKIPLIRYNTKDFVQLLPYQKISSLLSRFGIKSAKRQYQMPYIALWGKFRSILIGSNEVFSEQVKEALYESFQVAGKLTGQFSMGRVNSILRLQLQLSPNQKLSAEEKDLLQAAIKKWIPGGPVVQVYPFDQYPHLAMSVV